MPDLSQISTALAGLSGEIAALRSNVEANRRAREELAAQPLPLADVREIMMAEVDRLAAAAPSLLEKQMAMIAARPNKSDWGHRLPFLPADLEGLGQLLVGLLAGEVKSGLTAALAARPEVPNAGPARAVRSK